MERSVANPIPAGSPSTQRRNPQASFRPNASGSPLEPMRDWATTQVGSVASETMPRPQKKAMPIGRTQEPLGPATRQTLVRQPDRVPDGRAEYAAEDVSFRHQEPCTSAGDTGTVSQPSRIGSFRILSPVSAKSAFVTAGTIGGVPGSPTPPGASPLGVSRTSTSGASSIRSIG